MQQPLMFKLDQDSKGRGLRCDNGGLFLGPEALLCRDHQGQFEARPVGELQEVFGRVYGNDATNWESRVRSVKLVASALNKGEMARAMMTAVLMRLPDPGDSIRIADVDGVLSKAGFDPGEPRDERGRWTTGGSGNEAIVGSDESGARAIVTDQPQMIVPANTDRRPAGVQLADIAVSDASDDPMREAAVRATDIARQMDIAPKSQSGLVGLDSRHQEPDKPNIILAAAEGDEDKDPRFGIGGNYPPPEELIPRTLLQSPAGPGIQFFDNLLDITGPGDEANLKANTLLERALLYRIHQIDPNYAREAIEPPGGLAGMSWQGRQNVISGLQADLAAAIFRVHGDIRPLQEVTFEFTQRTANTAYELAVRRFDAGELPVPLTRGVAIGNEVDEIVRIRLRAFFDGLRIQQGPGSAVRVNRRAYNSLGYRLPDARVGDLAFDVSLEAKTSSKEQIRDFFRSDFKPRAVVIVRPNQLGNNSSYIIPRPEGE